MRRCSVIEASAEDMAMNEMVMLWVESHEKMSRERFR